MDILFPSTAAWSQLLQPTVSLQAFSSAKLSLVLLLFTCIIIKVFQSLWQPRPKPERLPPGPRPWPVVGNLLQVGSVPHHGMQEMNARYGPLVYLRLGSVRAVVTDDPRVVREFLRRQDHVFASRPKNIASEHFTYGGQDIAFSPYGAHWRSMRRLCLFELLTPKRLEYYRQGRMEEVRCMVRDVVAASEAGRAVNLRDAFGGLSSNLLTRMILGKRFFGVGDAGPAQAAEHKALIYASFALLNAFNVADYLPFLRPFDPQGRERAMKRIMRRVDDIYDAIIAEHRRMQRQSSANSAHDDHIHTNFVDLLLSLPGENGEPHLKQATIKAILIDLVAAGTDTSSITSEWTMAELIRNPDIMQKVREEIDRVVGTERVVEEADVCSLNYLRAVVKEIFRLHPVGAFLIPHVSLEDTQVDGYHIPKNTRILINTYSLGRNPRVWDRPLEFLPERFLLPNHDQQQQPYVMELNDPDLRIVPFGAGRRGCPGATLGSTVVLLGLARLIQGFHWAPSHACKSELKEAYGLMVLEQPLQAFATPRLSPHLY